MCRTYNLVFIIFIFILFTDSNASTRNYIKKCKSEIQNEDKELQDTYKAMFNKASEKT